MTAANNIIFLLDDEDNTGFPTYGQSISEFKITTSTKGLEAIRKYEENIRCIILWDNDTLH